MGQKKKDPAERMTYITAGFTQRELRIIERAMEAFGITQSAAIRMLVRRGARGPAVSPFTPTEGTDHE